MCDDGPLESLDQLSPIRNAHSPGDIAASGATIDGIKCAMDHTNMILGLLGCRELCVSRPGKPKKRNEPRLGVGPKNQIFGR